MRGLLSATPGPSAIRLMVGTHLLLLIQAALVFALALAALCAAIHGVSEDDRPSWWRRRHGH